MVRTMFEKMLDLCQSASFGTVEAFAEESVDNVVCEVMGRRGRVQMGVQSVE